MERVLRGLDQKFHASERLSVEELRTLARMDAMEIGQERVGKPPPPFSAYARDVVLSAASDTSLQGLIDQALMPRPMDAEEDGGQLDQGWDWGPDSGYEDDFLDAHKVDAVVPVVMDIPPEADRKARCMDWWKDHEVVPGVDWGTLPEQIRVKWQAYGCDEIEEITASDSRPPDRPDETVIVTKKPPRIDEKLDGGDGNAGKN